MASPASHYARKTSMTTVKTQISLLLFTPVIMKRKKYSSAGGGGCSEGG